MTKKELRTMYDKMSLSEERMTELEKRLDDCFEHEPENISDFEETELMQFSQEYKPAPQRRNPLKIVVTSAAAAAVVAVGVTAAFKTGIIPTGTPVSEFTPDVQTENKDYMKLTYFGHGTNTALEEDGADRYLWAGAYGVCNAKGQYWNEKLVGRVKYVKGATVKTNECNDYYYIGDYTDLHPSIDAENDLLTINYGDSKNSSYRCFVIYKLSEAKKAPMTNVTITCTDGFQTDRPASTNPVSVVVRCHDLTTLTPVARPRFLKTGYGASGATYYDWQGYDVHKNRLYYAEGQSNYNLFGSFYSGSSFAYVTVFDFEGNIVEERTQVAVVSDKDKLTQIGVSVFGTLEAEGIKVCKDKLYLGYTARGITADNTKHYQNIFVFDPSSK
mgnify:CR=1 FL=1